MKNPEIFRLNTGEMISLAKMIGGTFHSILADQLWSAMTNRQTMQEIIDSCNRIDQTLSEKEWITTPFRVLKNGYRWHSNSGNITFFETDTSQKGYFIVESYGGNILSFLRKIRRER